MSVSSFLVGAVREWSTTQYLTLCLSPKADFVPKLTPFLREPLDPITPVEDQIVHENEPAETATVSNPKPIDDLWLYTALPIAMDSKSVVRYNFL